MIEFVRRLALAVLLAAAAESVAAVEPSLHVIPVAAHLSGANATHWRTDLWLQNPGDAPVDVELALVRSAVPPGENPFPIAAAALLMLAPGETRTLEDLLDDGTGAPASGSVIVSGTGPVVAFSRTYSVAGDGSTVGQAVPPAAVLAGPGHSGAVLPGVSNNGAYRSNVGLFAAVTGDALEVEITLLHPTGAPASSETVRIDGTGFSHAQFPLPGPLDSGSVRVRIVSGEGVVVPYVSVVDNRSADAVLVSGPVLSSGTQSSAAVIRDLMRLASR